MSNKAKKPEHSEMPDARHRSILGALEEVMAWIDNWNPDFAHEAEWEETKAIARAAIARARASDSDEGQITPHQMHILRHSLGISHGGRCGGRNHYFPGPMDVADCAALELMGLMESRERPWRDGRTYFVTEKGKVAAYSGETGGAAAFSGLGTMELVREYAKWESRQGDTPSWLDCWQTAWMKRREFDMARRHSKMQLAMPDTACIARFDCPKCGGATWASSPGAAQEGHGEHCSSETGSEEETDYC